MLASSTTAIANLLVLDAADEDPRVRDDLAVVLAWAGRNAEAVATFERLPAGRVAPAYVRLEITRAYRRLGRFAEAEALAREAAAANPTRPTGRTCCRPCWPTAAQ